MQRSKMTNGQHVKVNFPDAPLIHGKTGRIRRIQIARDGGAFVEFDDPIPEELDAEEWPRSRDNSLLMTAEELEPVVEVTE